MVNQELQDTISQAASAALLRIATEYSQQGLLHQALTPFLKIVAYYPDSEEAAAAVQGVIGIAQSFEEQDQKRIALSVYDRLERASRFGRWDGHMVTPEGDIL
jgi:hypothetical protein